jgi:hypothetical protein
MAGKMGGAIALAIFLLLVPVIVVLHVRRALWCDLAPGITLRITDRIEAETYEVRFTGPGGEHGASVHAGGFLAGGLEPLGPEKLADAIEGPFVAAVTAPAEEE